MIERLYFSTNPKTSVMTDLVKFNGANLICLKDENSVFVAIKPVCDAIGLDSDWQIKAITDDEILGAERCEHTVQLSGFTDETTPGLDENTHFQGRKMVFLPLEFLHGWLFQVKPTNTMKEETKANLIRFKRECYRVLFLHFFGNMRKQIEANEAEIKLLEEINLINEQKTELTATIREKKTQLDKVRSERLKKEWTLF